MPSPPQPANAELAAQIVAALRESDYIEACDEQLVLTLLGMDTTKAGDWRRLLEKNLSPTTTDAEHATTHYAA